MGNAINSQVPNLISAPNSGVPCIFIAISLAAYWVSLQQSGSYVIWGLFVFSIGIMLLWLFSIIGRARFYQRIAIEQLKLTEELLSKTAQMKLLHTRISEEDRKELPKFRGLRTRGLKTIWLYPSLAILIVIIWILRILQLVQLKPG